MRRFIVYYRRDGDRWRQLRPGLDDKTCKRAAVQAAIRYMRNNPAVEGVAVRVRNELFNVMAAEPDACHEFTFPED
jgi:hypothetical protein